MTLVIAKKIDGCVILVSDTALTQNDDASRIALVKTAILDGETTLSFSGSPIMANQAAQTLTDAGARSFAEVKGVLLPLHEQSEGTTEFLFTHRDRVFCVKNLEMTAVSTSWLGDYAGYRAVRAIQTGHYSVPPNSAATEATVLFPGNNDETIVSASCDLLRAMRVVIEEPQHVSVGGFAILVTNRDGFYKYEPYSELRFGTLVTRPDGTTTTAEGEFRQHEFSLGATTDTTDPTIIAYYGAGNIAFAMRKSDSLFPDQITVVHDVDPSRAQASIADKIGLDFNMMQMVHERQSTQNTRNPGD